jgi:hypothetical protein
VRNTHPQTTRRFIPTHKENKHESGRTKKSEEAQATKEAPCYEEVHSGEEIKGGGSSTLKNPNCTLLKKTQRRGARKIDERRRTCSVRWSEAIKRNQAYEVFSAACT